MIKTEDKTANATYYTLEPTSLKEVAKTIPVSPKCNVDIDEDGFPIGIEVLF